MALVYRNHELLYQQAYDITAIMDSEVISAAILIVFARIFISKLILWLQVLILGQPIVLRIEYFVTGERHETKIRHRGIVNVYLPMVSGSENSFLKLYTWSLKLILQLTGSSRLTISRQPKLLWFQWQSSMIAAEKTACSMAQTLKQAQLKWLSWNSILKLVLPSWFQPKSFNNPHIPISSSLNSY